ncbi:alpha-1D adrenergic receptor-like isoform X2 [Penaeus japonicus]|uniref:alpha-1D adrenergic receptor-like isoform X2 n=1 Tax=Penaeus japonicus TaxID=27405 RepID=UPI001C7155AF|nr:alpha-1D adrenergic receptor-like isoform X2 [Penaeus japonicus]
MDHIDNPTWYPNVDHIDMSNIEAESEIAKMSRGVATSIAVLFIGYMILGLTGNFLTILALLRCPRVRNVTAAFIISLCVADFLFCVLVLPWEVSRFLAGKWLWGDGWICTLFPLLRYWNVAVSLLSIAMITINRYIMIAHFSVYKSVYRKGWIALMIAFCWVFAFVMLLPTLLNKWGRFGFDPRLQTCSILDDNNKSPKQVLFGIGFCVPAIIIVICYSLIFFVIHKSEMRMRHHSTRGMNGAHTGPSLQSQVRGTGKMEREARRRRNEWRITKMVLIIFIAFLVTYLPITLVKNLDKKVNYPGLHVLGYVLIYISSCINPVIYVIMNRQYRQAYKTVLLCKRPRLPSLTSSHSELPKGSASRRFASSRCSSCMSQGTLGGSARVTPPRHDLDRPRPLSLHDDLCLRKKQPFRFRLFGFDTPRTQSVEMVSMNGTRTPLEPAKSCDVLRIDKRSRCLDCHTRRNTQRNSFLHSEFVGRKNGKDECQDLECSSKAFLDHLLKVEASSSTETPSSSRSHSPKEARKQHKKGNRRAKSDEDIRELRKKEGLTSDDAQRRLPDVTQEQKSQSMSQKETADPQTAADFEDSSRTAKTNRRSVASTHSSSHSETHSTSSSEETRKQTSTSPSSSSAGSYLNEEQGEVLIRPKNLSASCDLLREVSRDIYDRHASWAPWVPDLYPALHDDKAVVKKVHDKDEISPALHEDKGVGKKVHDRDEVHPTLHDEDKTVSETVVHDKDVNVNGVHDGTNALHDDFLEGYDNLCYED